MLGPRAINHVNNYSCDIRLSKESNLRQAGQLSTCTVYVHGHALCNLVYLTSALCCMTGSRRRFSLRLCSTVIQLWTTLENGGPHEANFVHYCSLYCHLVCFSMLSFAPGKKICSHFAFRETSLFSTQIFIYRWLLKAQGLCAMANWVHTIAMIAP